MIDFKGGWKKDKYDPRDYLHKPAVPKLPNVVDLSQIRAAVRQQGGMNSCVGHGVRGISCAVAMSLGCYTEDYSPQYIWNGARFIEGTLSQNVGVFPKDALDWTVMHGLLYEHLWPYSPNVLDMATPSTERQNQAIKYPELAYFRVVDGINGILSALADSLASVQAGGVGWLVAIGCPWPALWMDPGQSGILSLINTGDVLAGGHETFLWGYDASRELLYGENSWDIIWGDKGMYYMPFSAIGVFKAWGGYDAHYITFKKVEPVPTPIPTPTPAPTAMFHPTSGKAGVAVQVSGLSWAPGEYVTSVSFGATKAFSSLTIDANGALTGYVVVPNIPAGLVDITIVGSQSGAATFTKAFTVKRFCF